jgi:hypothetical protein
VLPKRIADLLAALASPPRVHRRRYFGVPTRTAAHRKVGGNRERPGVAYSVEKLCRDE